MPEATVSVVLAVYNGERFLAEALRSVLAQTVPPEEVVVIDDGSTDGTAAVARGFSAVRYARQDNGGQGRALDHGVSLCRGRLVGFLDADDLWTPDKLAWQVAALREDIALEAVFGHAVQFEDGAAAERSRLPAAGAAVPARLPGAMLIRREALHRVGPFDGGYRVANVVQWGLRAAECGLRTRMLDEVVLRRRIHDRNIGITNKEQVTADYLAIARAAIGRRRARHATATNRGEQHASEATPR
jgi:glycosyltransferase involved in cell wall biosynthesis